MSAVVSWSGGKDCYLALELALERGIEPTALLTILTEGGERSRSHGLTLAALEHQAAALGLPLVTRSAAWEEYEEVFDEALAEFSAGGVDAGIFGDIDGDANRDWVVAACARAGIAAIHPLWHAERRTLVAELDSRGVTAIVTVVRDGVLPPTFLGRRLGLDLAAELAAVGVDLCGELGEFHTVVLEGSLFSHPLAMHVERVVARDGVHVLDLELTPAAAPLSSQASF